MKIPKDLKANAKDLQFIYDRMIYVHGESEDVDYMIRFKEIIDETKFLDTTKEKFMVLFNKRGKD